jgi:peptide/nickel transport system permease protein
MRLAAAVAVLLGLAALLAPWLSPQDPRDIAQLDLERSLLPPMWLADGRPEHPLGTDEQGRDVLSGLLYGLRTSLSIALAAVALAALAGSLVGLVAARAGGLVDALLMRLGDVQLAFPALLVAMLVDGVARATMPAAATNAGLATLVVIGAIALANWVVYARTVRAGAQIELQKDYVAAARLAGAGEARVLFAHVLPNVVGTAAVLASVHLATAIITEATLSFLGVGLPYDVPSLGGMVAVGQQFLFSGQWWLVVMPAATLVVLCVSLNRVGDGLREALDPVLR